MKGETWTVPCAPAQPAPDWAQKVLTPYRKMDGGTGLAAWTARGETEADRATRWCAWGMRSS